jgi:hypothetical protein
MKFVIIAFLSSLLLTSCNYLIKTTTISIFNNTRYVLDSIRIRTIELDTTIGKVLPGQKTKANLTIVFKENSEGVFLLTAYPGNFIWKDTTLQFGYYSGISDIDSRYDIELCDSFLLKQHNVP